MNIQNSGSANIVERFWWVRDWEKWEREFDIIRLSLMIGVNVNVRF
jgi:hypothetical protein